MARFEMLHCFIDYLNPPKNRTNIGIYHVPLPEAALDGYTRTCSKTCYGCETTGAGFGFWSYRFPYLQTVTEVHILACRDGRYLYVSKSKF